MGHYLLHKDHQHLWRWRFVAANGRIISVSSESYHNESDCMNSINIMKNSTNAPVYRG